MKYFKEYFLILTGLLILEKYWYFLKTKNSFWKKKTLLNCFMTEADII